MIDVYDSLKPWPEHQLVFVDAGIASVFVTPLALYLCSRDCRLTHEIFSVGAELARGSQGQRTRRGDDTDGGRGQLDAEAYRGTHHRAGADG